MDKSSLLNLLVKRNEDVTTVQMGDETGMLNIETGNYYVLNSIASDIWEELSHPQRVLELINKLTIKFEIESDTCEKDVCEYIQYLLDKQLISGA